MQLSQGVRQNDESKVCEKILEPRLVTRELPSMQKF